MPRLRTLYLSLAGGFIACYAFFFYYLLGSVSAATVPRVVDIPQGASMHDIARILHDVDLIRSPRAFVFWGIFSGTAHRLRPGRYSFTGEEGPSRILRTLLVGPEEKAVVIPEGSTLKEIDAILARAGIIAPGELLLLTPEMFTGAYAFLAGAESLEGYLFPDTYLLLAGDSPEVIAKKFLDAFAVKALPVFLKEGVPLGSKKFHEAVILASLLEKEVPLFGDRQLVAGVLKRRLALGIPLQVDASVIYAKCGAFTGCAPLVRSDFSRASALNTYYQKGLPPQAIGNPGLSALQASLTPRSSSYLYYLSDPKTGKTYFTSTFEAHDALRAQYLF